MSSARHTRHNPQRGGCILRSLLRVQVAVLVPLLSLLLPSFAQASGPRFVTGPPYFTGQAGVPIGWKQTNLMYFTDPGDLSKSVNHEAADALVAAAAGTWNIPIASITVGRGGSLAEHVSGQNVYLDQTGMVFPPDVMSANAAAIPIAVIYDTDGSVIDTLLGGGAGDPAECRDNGVVDTVDRFDPGGYIVHAVIVVNGRCTGAAPQMQLQMQYQLMRAFGRVLGLGWSQTNDNAFTGTPQPTRDQLLHWPIMHPVDILCRPYSYQCLPNPFQLRPDDMASMVELYALWDPAKLPPGKHTSLQHAHMARGHIWFPTTEGMAGVNVVLRRRAPNQPSEGWYEASSVTGSEFVRAGRSPFVAGGTDAWSSFGTPDQNQMGAYFIAYVPVIDGLDWNIIGTVTEPVNPLYTGTLSVGAFAVGNPSPSGSTPVMQETFYDGLRDTSSQDYTVADAGAACGSGEDGTAAAPVAVPLTGWWNGLLCGMGHAAYTVTGVRPGRSFTVEVTALDEQGFATELKAMPVIGLFAPADGVGALPSVGVAPAAFQALTLGTTTIRGHTGQMPSLRLGIADQRGLGRPDFAYQARLFYADSVSPPQLPVDGGNITIAGMGFRGGNGVSINGVAAKVVSWSSTALVVVAPAMPAAHASDGVTVDVQVTDRGTGADSTMSAALTYTSGPRSGNAMKLVSIPAGTVYVGDLAVPEFAVRVLGPDGVTPVAGETVVFSASTGVVKFAGCGLATCRVTSDASGLAATGITPLSPGTVTMSAVDGTLTQSGSFVAEAQAGAMAIAFAPSGDVLMAVVAQPQFGVLVTAGNGAPLAGRAVTFTASSATAKLGDCAASVCSVLTNGSGLASVAVTPGSVGALTIEARDGDLHRSISLNVLANLDVMKVQLSPAGQYVFGTAIDAFAVRLFQSNGLTPDVGRQVTFTSTVGASACGGPTTCTVFTDYLGVAPVTVSASALGQFTLVANYGSVSQTASFSVIEETIAVTIVSAPSGTYRMGQVIDTPFTVQLTGLGGRPAPWYHLSLSGPLDRVRFTACASAGGCAITADGNGRATTQVIALKAGIVTLSATSGASTMSTSFEVTGNAESFKQLQTPPVGTRVTQDAIFGVQLIGPDGVTPEGNAEMSFQVVSGPGSFTLCSPLCTLRTDGNGYASVYAAAYAPGLVTVRATKDQATLVMSYTALPLQDSVSSYSSPAYFSTVGRIAPLPFAVHVLDPSNKNVGAGKNVTLSVTTGSASFVACAGASTCVLATDKTGGVSSLVIPMAVGPVTLAASEGGGQTSAGFVATAPQPGDAMAITEAGGGSVYQGATAATHLTVRASDAYGTPIAGLRVTLASTGLGSVRLGVCGAASCDAVTDANGNASTLLTGVTAGALTLSATADLGSGSKTISAPFQVKAHDLSLTALMGMTYIAEGGRQGLTLSARAVMDGTAAFAQPVHWTATGTPPGFRLATPDSVTDASGMTSVQAELGPLVAGAHATATACAWTNTCAQFDATAVALSDLRLALLSGAQQTVRGGAMPVPVVASIVDAADHPVAVATVNVYQTVSALNADCPVRGRCPVSPILSSLVSVLTSGSDGRLSVNPLTLVSAPGNPLTTQTEIAFSVGTSGFATAIVTVGR